MGILSVEALKKGEEYLLELRGRDEIRLAFVRLNSSDTLRKGATLWPEGRAFDFTETSNKRFGTLGYYLFEREYGRTWRVWDVMECPDEETRKAAKWDA